jgi:MFS family permease
MLHNLVLCKYTGFKFGTQSDENLKESESLSLSLQIFLVLMSVSGINIPRLYLIKVAKWFMLYMPVIVLFYQSNGLDMQDVFILQAIYSIAIVVLEIPSGYFADVWGRKFTMIAGGFLGVAGFITYSLTNGFWGFLVAELILGVGQSMISGSDSALLYDSLLHDKREKEYIKTEGKIISIGNFSETLAAIAGGFLAEITLRTPFIAQIAIAMLAIPAALTLVEPPKASSRKATLKEVLNVVKETLHLNKSLRDNILISSLIGTSTLTFAWFVQPWLKEAGESPGTIGVIWSLLNLTVGITTLYAYYFERRLGKIKTIWLIVVLVSGCYIASGIWIESWALLFLFVFYFARGIATPVLKDYINRLTRSEVRATVLSIRNFIIRFNFVLIGPFLGWYTEHYSLSQALWLAGIIFFAGSVIFLIPVIRQEKREDIE